MEKKFKVYCLRNREGKIVYIGATRTTLSKRFGKGYRTFSHKELKIELIQDFDTKEQMFQLESMLIQHYKLENLLNKVETTSTGIFPKGFTHKKSFQKGNNGDKLFGEKRKKASYESCRIEVKCSNGKVYKSLSEASRELNLHISNIKKVLKGLRTHTGGYSFEYVSNANTEID